MENYYTSSTALAVKTKTVIAVVILFLVFLVFGTIIGVAAGMTSGEDPSFPENTDSRIKPGTSESRMNKDLFRTAPDISSAVIEHSVNVARNKSFVRGFCFTGFKVPITPTKAQLRVSVKKQNDAVDYIIKQLQDITDTYDSVVRRVRNLQDFDYSEIESNRIESQLYYEAELKRRQRNIDELERAISSAPDHYVDPRDPKILNEKSTRTLQTYSGTIGEPYFAFNRLINTVRPSLVSTSNLVSTPVLNDLLPRVVEPRQRRTDGENLLVPANSAMIHDGYIIEETFEGLTSPHPEGSHFLDILSDSVFKSLAMVGALDPTEVYEGRGREHFPEFNIMSTDAETKITWREREGNGYINSIRYIVTKRPVSESIAEECNCHIGPLPEGAELEAAYKNANFAKLLSDFFMSSSGAIQGDGTVIYGESTTGAETFQSTTIFAPSWIQMTRRGEIKEGETITIENGLYVTFPFAIQAPFDDVRSSYLFTTGA